MTKKVAVIGAGFAGLSAATCLSQKGFDVTICEKNSTAGGRAGRLQSNGFTFDMGPSWYWMPDVFESYFALFDKKPGDYYSLQRLNPSYRVYYGKEDFVDIPAGIAALCDLFDKLEPGSSQNLVRFLEEGKYKYEIGIHKLVYKPGISWTELADYDLLQSVLKLHIFQSISSYVRKFFKEPRLIRLLEFPVLFLGATADKTPALYSLMNYADMALGTWYPIGGMFEVVKGMAKLAEEQGVKFQYNNPVREIQLNAVKANGLRTARGFVDCDYVIAAADYHHVEQELLPATFRKYSEKYWNERVLAPSSLLFFIGLNKKIKGLQHHTLFFDEDFNLHAKEIYSTPRWPTAPQFYVSCASISDPNAAPAGGENLVVLIPVAPGLVDDEHIREHYFSIVMHRMETILGEEIQAHIVFKRSYAHDDFAADYNAFKGNAYGLANTLLQTANLKPSIRSKKVNNLFYTGQLTVPGPGVPPSIISGQVTAQQIILQETTGGKKM